MANNNIMSELQQISELVFKNPASKILILIIFFSPIFLRWFAQSTSILSALDWVQFNQLRITMFLLMPMAWFIIGGVNLDFPIKKCLLTFLKPKNFINYFSIFVAFGMPVLLFKLANDYVFQTESFLSFVLFTALECLVAWYFSNDSLEHQFL